MQNQAQTKKNISVLSDTELLSNTRVLIGRSNQVFAALLAHLGEVEARGLHRTCACSSLYAYCINELRLSEDAAVRRVTAARFVRQFPALLQAIAAGELHLTGLLMLDPHLTRDNHLEVLACAKHRTKKEIVKLVRVLDPLPAVPAKIEVLAPARPSAARATWENHTTSFCPVRELPPGDRPRDWTDEPLDGSSPARIAESARDLASPDCADHGMAEPLDGSAPARIAESARDLAPADGPRDRTDEASSALRASSEPSASPRPFGPLRYKVQFTATEEYVELIERARALLSKRRGSASIDEIQLEALRVFVTSLEKKRYGAGNRAKPEPTRVPTLEPEPRLAPAPRLALDSDASPKPRSRHIPAAVRRAVFERDAARCTYVDATGRRCAETHYLELHHRKPFAQGGEHSEANLALRCSAHNALAAELDFGPLQIAAKRDALRHLPPLAALAPPNAPQQPPDS